MQEHSSQKHSSQRHSFVPRRFLLLPVATAILLGACSYAMETPECPYTNEQGLLGNAGCLITYQDQVLIVERRWDKKLDFPGGTAGPNEPARCTAFRETYEETGHVVEVDELLQTFSSGYKLYRCQSVNPSAPLEVHDNVEITSAYWRLPGNISPDQWRFPYQFNAQINLIERPEKE